MKDFLNPAIDLDKPRKKKPQKPFVSPKKPVRHYFSSTRPRR